MLPDLTEDIDNQKPMKARFAKSMPYNLLKHSYETKEIDPIPHRKLRTKAKTLSFSKPSMKLSRYDINKHYEVGDRLGFGTYAQVFKAVDLVSGKIVAIKKSKGTSSISKLKDEYEILRSLDHQNIPKVHKYEIDVANNTAYMIIEYFEGVTVDAFIESGKPKSVLAKSILEQLFKTVEYLHSIRV